MFKKLLQKIVIALIPVAILACQQDRPLTDYEPRSSQEESVKKVLLAFQEGVLTQDSKKVEALIHENASIMIGSDRKMLSKTEYAEILSYRLAENSSIFLGTPKIDISGDKAEIRIYMKRGGGRFLMVFTMLMENDQWYILKWEY